MSGDDPSAYLPPHELRGLMASLVDRGDATGAPRLPGPSAAAGSPGLATAAATPGPLAPTLPPDDPAALSIALARVVGEPLVATSLVPAPVNLDPSFTAAGPGISPQLAPGGPSMLGGPSIPAAPASEETVAPSIAPARPDRSDASPVGDPFEELGGEVRVPFADLRSTDLPLADVPVMDQVTSSLPPVGGVGAAMSAPAPFAIPAGLDPAPVERVDFLDTPVRSSGGTPFDPYLVRRDFPILDERVHGGKRLVWLDNAATTQKPRAVIDRLTYYYEHENSNVHRGAHVLAARATDAYESARETTRKFLNAPTASEIVFVRGATEGINLIAKAWGQRYVERGDEILLTHLEHHANIVPWQQLAAAVGATLRIAPVDDRGDVILEEYEKLLSSRTRVVAFTQVSNALGTVTPARDMIEAAHRWGATVVLDGAQAVSHMPVDVQALDCDFYVFSGHKVFAPTGIGVVYGKRPILDRTPPWQGGGNMIQDVTFERTTYQEPPWRFEAGTSSIADAAGLGAALDYVMRIGMTTIDRYEHELLVYATERLQTVPGLRMIGTSRHKAGVLSFVLDGQRTEDVGAALDKEGIAVRSGHHCAQPILRRFGLEASVRASLAFYNVREDIDALVDALRRLQGRVR